MENRIERLSRSPVENLGHSAWRRWPRHIVPLLLIVGLVPATGRAGGGLTFTEYPLSPGAFGFHITAGPGGFWFTEPAANRIAQFSAVDGHLTEYPIPTANSMPALITFCPDGNLWFTEQAANQIARCTPEGTITEFPVPTVDSRPFGITCTVDLGIPLGGPTTTPILKIHFTQVNGNKIGRADVVGDVATFIEVPIPTPMSSPAYITPDRFGDLWFTEAAASRLGKLNPQSGQIVEFPVPTQSILNGLTTAPGGTLYFPEYLFGNNIGSINPADPSMREIPIPTPSSGAFHGVVAADDQYYFTEQFGNKVGRLNLQTFQIDEYSFSGGGGPSGLATMFRSADSSAPIIHLAVLLPDRPALAVAQIDRPVLDFTKIAIPLQVHPDEEQTYTFTVTNNGQSRREFYIRDWLPAFLEAPPGQPGWHDASDFWGPGRVSETFGVDPGSSRALFLRVIVHRIPGPFTNEATLMETPDSHIVGETSVNSQVIP